MVIEGLITLLTGTGTPVYALVAARVYQGELPRGYTFPAIAVHRYGGSQEYQFDGPVGVREDQVQFDCYASDAETAQQVAEAVRSMLVGYVGTLSDGSVVQGCYLERDMDMPFLPHADAKGLASRSLLGFRVVSVRV